MPGSAADSVLVRLWKQRFKRPLTAMLTWLAVSTLFVFIHRIAFIILYHSAAEGQSTAEWSQFLLGLRFDLATAPLFTLPVLLLLPLYAWYERLSSAWRHVLRVAQVLQLLWAGGLNMILMASTYQFAVNNKHLGWEFYAYLEDLDKLVGGVWLENPIAIIFLFSMIPLFLLAGYYLFYRYNLFARDLAGNTSAALASRQAHSTVEPARSPAHNLRPMLIRTGSFILAELVLCSVILILLRGGVQQTTIRAADAMLYQSAYLNNLPLNGLFTVTYDLLDRGEFEQYYDQQENINFVHNLLDEPDAFISDDYPLLRRMPPRANATRGNNIVIVVLESFTAKFLAEHGGDPAIAPELQKLINEGAYFRRFIASGGRSANGLFCMLAGIPDRAGRTIMRSNQIQNRMGGLGSLLKDKGYETMFVHGGDLDFDNLDKVLPRLGFDVLFGSRAIESTGRYSHKTPWGYDDADTFDLTLHLMDRATQPFFTMVFSVNTHHPYIIPDESYAYFDESVPQHQFLNSYRYTDKVVGDFIRSARTRPYFKNTVFIFVADHTHHAGINYLEDRHIPFLVYAPGRIPARKIDTIASQLDVLPTVLSLAGGDAVYAAMGNDLFAPRREDFAFYAGGSNTNLIGWIEGDYLLVRSLTRRMQFLLSARPPVSGTDISAEHPDITARYLERSLHFHQLARYTEMENRIWPEADEWATIKQDSTRN